MLKMVEKSTVCLCVRVCVCVCVFAHAFQGHSIPVHIRLVSMSGLPNVRTFHSPEGFPSQTRLSKETGIWHVLEWFSIGTGHLLWLNRGIWKRRQSHPFFLRSLSFIWPLLLLLFVYYYLNKGRRVCRSGPWALAQLLSKMAPCLGRNPPSPCTGWGLLPGAPAGSKEHPEVLGCVWGTGGH